MTNINNKLEELKNEYENIEIPDELDFIVRDTIYEAKTIDNLPKKRFIFDFSKFGIAAACMFGVFVTAINVNPAFADSLEDIPVIGSVVKVLSVRNYIVDENGYNADIKVPEVSGLGNEELEKELNEQFIQEGQKQYDEFIKELDDIKAAGGQGHKAVETDYEVKSDNDSVFSIVLTRFEAAGSSDTQYKTYTVDKKNKTVVSLKSLFKDDSYIQVISDYIKNEMRSQMKNDEGVIYSIDNTEFPEDNFYKIDENQMFYINEDGKLVIMFNKYDVAPGYMGTPEFLIPTDKINHILLDRGLLH